MTDLGGIEDLISAGGRARSRTATRRARLAIAVPAAATIVWLGGVTLQGHWDRVIDNWAAALTMVFGSFVAGSTPQGGGAVAFPVFTKVLGVPSDVARSFSLCIQTIGMGAATAMILIRRRSIERQAITHLIPSALFGFLVSLLLLSDRSAPFWPARVPGAYVKVAFTVILAAMAFVVFLAYRPALIERRGRLDGINGRVRVGLLLAGFIGGFGSALVGSGADVATYVLLTVLIGLNPQVGVPSSVVVMTAVSIVGFAVLGIGAGQLDVGLSGDGQSVVSIDGRPVGTDGTGSVVFSDDGVSTARVPRGQADLFGLWLAAVPIVAWGAPLGSSVAARFSDRALVRFVVALAALEVLSTLIFLTELYRNPALATFAALSSVVTIGGLYWLATNRGRVLGLASFDTARAVTPLRIDVTDDFAQSIDRGPNR